MWHNIGGKEKKAFSNPAWKEGGGKEKTKLIWSIEYVIRNSG
jgi:hypothetical protein